MGHLPDVSMNRTNIWLKPPPRFHWSCTNEVPKTLHLSCKQTKSHLGSSEFIHCHRNVSNFQQQKAIWTLEHRKRNDQIIIHHIPIYTLKCLKRLLFQSSPIRSSGEFFPWPRYPCTRELKGKSHGESLVWYLAGLRNKNMSWPCYHHASWIFKLSP